MGFVAIYTIINRICECVERCAIAKAYGNYCIGMKIRSSNFIDEINNFENGLNERGTNAGNG